jgi:hydroxymethylpyrimidine/phosphomethylpyrimidine kinase
MCKLEEKNKYPIALTIAGSDSCGGAGIQADLRTFAAYGVYGVSAITAVTAQTPDKITAIECLSGSLVTAQLQAIFSSLAINTVKIGMLGNADIIQAVVNLLDLFQPQNIIIDPVLKSTSGTSLLEEEAIELMKSRLLPHATWFTPNVLEAEILIGIKIKNYDDMAEAALRCSELWNCVTIIKGGDFKPNGKPKKIIDFMASQGKIYELSAKRVKKPKDYNESFSHGTGCTFSSAIAASLALDMHWKDVAIASKAFVLGSLNETVITGDSTCAMYPPTGAYRNMVTFKQYS